MALFNLDKLLNRAEKFVSQDLAPTATKVWQHINPGSGYNNAQPLVHRANAQYQFTPQFSDTVNKGMPSLVPGFGQNGNLRRGVMTAAQFDSSNRVNQIQLSSRMSNPSSLVHEGLHRQFKLSPNSDKDKFFQAYNKALSNPKNESLSLYLASRLSGYKQAPSGNPKLTRGYYKNIGNLSPDIQNEVHSFIPEIYAYSRRPMPAELAKYYSRYFNPEGLMRYNPQPNRTQVLPKGFPSGLKKLLGDWGA